MRKIKFPMNLIEMFPCLHHHIKTEIDFIAHSIENQKHISLLAAYGETTFWTLKQCLVKHEQWMPNRFFNCLCCCGHHPVPIVATESDECSHTPDLKLIREIRFTLVAKISIFKAKTTSGTWRDKHENDSHRSEDETKRNTEFQRFDYNRIYSRAHTHGLSVCVVVFVFRYARRDKYMWMNVDKTANEMETFVRWFQMSFEHAQTRSRTHSICAYNDSCNTTMMRMNWANKWTLFNVFIGC